METTRLTKKEVQNGELKKLMKGSNCLLTDQKDFSKTNILVMK